MATVSDTLTWDAVEPEVRTYFEEECAPQGRLVRLLSMATSAADVFMKNPFTDSAGADTPLPAEILEGVLAYMYEYYSRTGTTAPAPGLTSIRTANLSEGYAGSSVTRVAPGKAALEAARPCWVPYRKQIWT